MKTLEELYKDLERYKDFDADKENVENFLESMQALLNQEKHDAIPHLLKYIEDDSDYDWVSEIIENNLCYFFKNNGSILLIDNIDFFMKKAPFRCESAFSIVFNDPESLNLFRQHIHLADKTSLLKLFDMMEKESPHHAALIQDLRKELNEQK